MLVVNMPSFQLNIYMYAYDFERETNNFRIHRIFINVLKVELNENFQIEYFQQLRSAVVCELVYETTKPNHQRPYSACHQTDGCIETARNILSFTAYTNTQSYEQRQRTLLATIWLGGGGHIQIECARRVGRPNLL